MNSVNRGVSEQAPAAWSNLVVQFILGQTMNCQLYLKLDIKSSKTEKRVYNCSRHYLQSYLSINRLQQFQQYKESTDKH